MMTSFEGKPAALKASFMKGMSKSSYRAEVVVSGTMKATLGRFTLLLFVTRPFSNFMVEKLVVNVVAETVDAAPLAGLMLGSMVATQLPAMTTAARAFAVLNFILPNPSVAPFGTDSF